MSERKKLVPRRRFPEFQSDPGWQEYAGSDLFEQVNNRDANADLPVLAITQEHGAIPRDLIDYHVSVSEQSLSGYKVVSEGDFIISLRSFQGGIEYSQYHGICSPAYVILRRRSKGGESYFRHYFKTEGFIRLLTKNLEGLRDGKMISYKQFSELRLPVPSRAEQIKISDCLSSLDKLIAAQTRKVEVLEAHKNGLMQQLFPREGETQPHLRFPEFRSAQEWRNTVLAEIAEIRSGSTPLRANGEYFTGGTIPWVKTTDLNNSFIETTEEYITPLAKARINPVGSVLVAMYGGFKQIGRTGCLNIPAATNQAISVLVLNRKIAFPEYVLAWLNAKVVSWRSVASSSRKDPNITGADVAKFPISLPSLPEQKKISGHFVALEQVIAAALLELDTLKTHKNALMQQLFPSAEALEA